MRAMHLHTLAFSCNFPKSLETVLQLYIVHRTLYLDISFNATCVELLPSYLIIIIIIIIIMIIKIIIIIIIIIIINKNTTVKMPYVSIIKSSSVLYIDNSQVFIGKIAYIHSL